MEKEEFLRVHALVNGRVQGVSFRFFVQENAHRLGISGWVRNRRDGSVEIIAEGNQSALEDLLAYLKQGPRAANVTDVKHEWLIGTGEFDSFRITRTA